MPPLGPEQETYLLPISKAEHDWIKTFRKKQNELDDSVTRKPIPPQTIYAYIYIGNDYRPFQITSDNIILEVAEMGVVIQDLLERDEWKDRSRAPIEIQQTDDMEVDSVIGDSETGGADDLNISDDSSDGDGAHQTVKASVVGASTPTENLFVQNAVTQTDAVPGASVETQTDAISGIHAETQTERISDVHMETQTDLVHVGAQTETLNDQDDQARVRQPEKELTLGPPGTTGVAPNPDPQAQLKGLGQRIRNKDALDLFREGLPLREDGESSHYQARPKQLLDRRSASIKTSTNRISPENDENTSLEQRIRSPLVSSGPGLFSNASALTIARTIPVTRTDADVHAGPTEKYSVYGNLERTEALYKRWRDSGTLSIPSEAEEESLPKQSPTVPVEEDQPASQLNPYFEDLVDLSIFAHERGVPNLSMDVHKTWQKANYHSDSDDQLPSVGIVQKAFDNLPISDPLLGYIVLFYSYEWTTATYKSFEEYEPLGKGFEKFLYGLSLTRCWSLTGWGHIILTNWCQFHGHKTLGEIKSCEAERDRLISVDFRKNLKTQYDEKARYMDADVVPRVTTATKRTWLKKDWNQDSADELSFSTTPKLGTATNSKEHNSSKKVGTTSFGTPALGTSRLNPTGSNHSLKKETPKPKQTPKGVDDIRHAPHGTDRQRTAIKRKQRVIQDIDDEQPPIPFKHRSPFKPGTKNNPGSEKKRPNIKDVKHSEKKRKTDEGDKGERELTPNGLV
ncbi:hypothetical protein GQ43DRAFT_472025 [Delitschia confertaspora ATCC 74209]|uniref:Uncharacterized protein n=1 Tax=Delitschia confertaspora ATCC 74209 TaxID=1513339 RepID=A0A9P4MYT5_9PLEO|nr:hypothetical protein GQ43DRAFT_472025 [Delitschia confertaspora ATCC 74209]